MTKTKVKTLHHLGLVLDLLQKVFCPTGPGGGVDPTCKPSGGTGGEGSYKIRIYDYEKDLVEDTIKEVFGKSVDHQKLCAVTGAPHGSKIALEVSTNRFGENSVKMRVSHDDYDLEATRLVSRDSEGKLCMENAGLSIGRSHRGSGFGTKLFQKQVDEASSLGIAYIRTDASANRGDNGYYTWPRLGYDKTLTKDDSFLFGHFPDRFGKIEKISDLMKTKEGRDWWKEQGETLKDMRFDLTEGSRSRKVLDAYVQERFGQG